MTKVVGANNATRTNPESVGCVFYQLLFLETPLQQPWQSVLPSYQPDSGKVQSDFNAEPDYILM